ncbi:MAG: hypothetical protein EXS51_03500 [Candidatus Taylorbacteria bacterium]|nr:hypothetical protein [Candidatus Taylorbacteria bacterium]
MSEKIGDGKGGVLGRVSGDGRTIINNDGEVSGHISPDGRTQYDKDWKVVGHTSADGREHLDGKWNKTGSTSKDGKESRDTSGKVSGRSRGLLSGGLLGGAVNLLRGQAAKADRGGKTEASIAWSAFAVVATIFGILLPIIFAFFGAVFAGFFVSLVGVYQLYMEKKRPEDFQKQNWLRNGVSTRWFRIGELLGKLPIGKLVKFRDFETPNRIGFFLGVPSLICGLFSLVSSLSASGQMPTSDWLAGIIFGLILLAQGIFVMWAGYHFKSVAETLQPVQSKSAVPPPLAPPGA